MSWIITVVIGSAIASTVYHCVSSEDPIIPTFIVYVLWIGGTIALMYFICWLIGGLL